MIIGLVGLIGSGKGTVAEIFEGLGCVQDSFAAPLKDSASAVFGWPRNLLEGNTIASREFREQTDDFWSEALDIPNFTPRLALQMLGTEVFRDGLHSDIWVQSLARRATVSHADVVVSDCRFPNEVDMIRQNEGVVIRVVRGENPEWWETACAANHGDGNAMVKMNSEFSHVHRSEWSLAGIPVDHVINNDGSLDDLVEKIQKLYNGSSFYGL